MTSTSKIHIYIYYNVVYENEITTDKYDTFIVNEVSIITDEQLVRSILTHPSTITNEYGEFIDYDNKFIRNIVRDDMITYKDKTQMDWGFEFGSFYYLKCEVVKNISNEIASFINNI